MIILVILIIGGIALTTIKAIDYYRRGVGNHWHDIIASYDLAWPKIELGDGNGSK